MRGQFSGRDGEGRFGLLCAGMLAASLLIGCGEADGTAEEGAPRVTLRSPSLAALSEGVRLEDGELVADGGDVALFLGVVLSLQAPVNDSDLIFCSQGTFAALADVPTDEQVCPGQSSGSPPWTARLFLSAATFHASEDSTVIGLSTLVWNSARDKLYRLRILGDSVSPNAEGSLGSATVTFEYEPVR